MNERNIHGSDRVRTCAPRNIQVFCCSLYQHSYTFVFIHLKSTNFPAAVIRTGNQSKLYPRIDLQYKDYSADCLCNLNGKTKKSVHIHYKAEKLNNNLAGMTTRALLVFQRSSSSWRRSLGTTEKLTFMTYLFCNFFSTLINKKIFNKTLYSWYSQRPRTM